MICRWDGATVSMVRDRAGRNGSGRGRPGGAMTREELRAAVGNVAPAPEVDIDARLERLAESLPAGLGKLASLVRELKGGEEVEAVEE